MDITNLLVLMLTFECYAKPPLHELYQFKDLDYEFPSPADREAALASGEFIPGNAVITNFQVSEEFMYFSLSRNKPGTPVTLARVPLNRGLRPESPLLQPFPNMAFNKEGNCDGITSSHSVHIDKCGRLSVVDSGKVDQLATNMQICQPQILMFDPETGELIYRYRLPDSVLKPPGLLLRFQVDVRDSCDDTFFYIGDNGANAVVVFDMKNEHAYRVENNFFYPFPFGGTFNFSGVQAQVMKGVSELVLSPLTPSGDRIVFFTSISSYLQSYVKASVLQDEVTANKKPEEFKIFTVPRYPLSQIDGTAIDDRGVLFYALLSRNSIGCWFTLNPFLPPFQEELYQDDKRLVFGDALNTYSNDVYILSNNYFTFMTNTLDRSQIYIRILKFPIERVIRGTACDPRLSPLPNQKLSQSPFGGNVTQELFSGISQRVIT